MLDCLLFLDTLPAKRLPSFKVTFIRGLQGFIQRRRRRFAELELTLRLDPRLRVLVSAWRLAHARTLWRL